MKIYKEKQYLIFDFEDGKTVKYDFATKTCIGKNGKEVNDLRRQLQGLTISQLCDCCTDKQYGKFLRFVKQNADYYGRGISNIGTILERVPHFANLEQIFSAGIDDIVDRNFKYKIGDIPKGLIKLCRDHKITLSNHFLDYYKENPDAYFLCYNLQYYSLSDYNIFEILTHETSVQVAGGYYWNYTKKSTFNILLNEYGYTAKALINYIDYLKTYEAIDDVRYLMRELYDYVTMMRKISPKFDKYPRNFLTTHQIASRNYNRLKETFDEEAFKSRIDKSMEKTFDNYRFIYPDSTQDIKNEAASMHNCVATYIKRVIDGQCHIMFLRYKDEPDKSLVTIEVRNGKIVQALQKYNSPLDAEQKEVVDKYNKWYSNKLKNESEELENVG